MAKRGETLEYGFTDHNLSSVTEVYKFVDGF